MSVATVHPAEPAAPVPRSVPILESEAEALAVARHLSAEFANEAAQRDRARRLPHAELDRFSGSGLWAISVPKQHGGLGASLVTIVRNGLLLIGWNFYWQQVATGLLIFAVLAFSSSRTRGTS
jgi:alkylation response protein AidB-like acyl-CoA dehydrogenase